MAERFHKLTNLITDIPAICNPIKTGTYENGFWWVKFSIDISDPLSWNVVQCFAYAINYLSISERLSTVFYPIAQPPFAATDKNCLEWIIESTSQDFLPNEFAEWLESRLPDPTKPGDWIIE